MKPKIIPKHHKKLLQHIGLIVKTYRQLELINQDEIESVHFNTLSALEKGKANPNLLNLLSICEELEVPLDLLFEGFSEKK